MARGETVGSLRAYFLIVGVVSGGLNVKALLTQPFGPATALVVLGLAIAGASMFLGLRIKTLIVTSPKLCRQIVMGIGVALALNAAVNVLMGSMIAAAQGAFGLLLVWYIIGNLRRLSGESGSGGPVFTADGQPVIVGGRAGAVVSNVVGTAILVIAAVGALAALVFLAPSALSMLDSSSESIDYVASGFMVFLPLALCGILAYVGLRMRSSTGDSGQ